MQLMTTWMNNKKKLNSYLYIGEAKEFQNYITKKII